jgi:hypothetical protein
LNTQIDELTNEIDEKNREIEELQNWINKIWAHPILWPLALKIILWEELDIPEYLKQYVDSNLQAIPNMERVNNISIPDQPSFSPQERLRRAASKLY